MASLSSTNATANHVADIESGGRIYPFRDGCTLADINSLSVLLCCTLPELPRKLHDTFDRLYRTPPHELSEMDGATWSNLLRYIDLEKFGRRNPTTQCLVGGLTHVETNEIVVHWFDGDEERLNRADLPCDFSSAKTGMWVHASYVDIPGGKKSWQKFDIEPEPQPLTADELRNHSLTTAPVGRWPRSEGES